MKSKISSNYSETQKLGEEFSKNIKPGAIVALHGVLGAGKTTFVQGIAHGLGIKNRIISPTFVLVREHRIKNYDLRIKKLYHIDIYRIESKRDLEGLGLDEILSDKNAVVAIEWAEKLGEKLPKDRIDIDFENLNENKRRITWSK